MIFSKLMSLMLNNRNESDIEYIDDEDAENFEPIVFDELIENAKGYPTEEFLSEIEAVAVRPASPRYNTLLFLLVARKEPCRLSDLVHGGKYFSRQNT